MQALRMSWSPPVRIHRVRIKNFRCLENLEIRFDGVTTLIGPNGVGKSSVLRALDWFFNGTRGGSLDDQDLTMGVDHKEISVEVEFRSLTNKDRAELGHYVSDSVDRFIAWRVRAADGSEKVMANAKSFGPFIKVRSAGNASAINTAYRELREESSGLELPVARGSNQVEEAMRAWESS